MVALIGVFFADRSNTKRLALQLEHDAKEKERDRLAVLRRDVYLQAPKEAVKALSYIASLAHKDLTKIGDDEGISGYAAVAAQIGVLSELSTVEAVNAFGNGLTKELTTALRELEGVQDTRVDIEIRDRRLAIVFDEITRMQAEQQKLSESGSRDRDRSDALQRWVEVRMEEASELRQELTTLRAAHQRALFDYHQAFFDRLQSLSSLSIDTMREIRKEIGLAHELNAFEKRMKQMSDELRDSVVADMKSWAEKLEG